MRQALSAGKAKRISGTSVEGEGKVEFFSTVHFISGHHLDVIIEADSLEAAVQWWQEQLSQEKPLLAWRGFSPKRPVVINTDNVAYVDSIERARPEAELRHPTPFGTP